MGARMRVFMSLNSQFFHFTMFSAHILLNKCLLISLSLSLSLYPSNGFGSTFWTIVLFDLFNSTLCTQKKNLIFAHIVQISASNIERMSTRPCGCAIYVNLAVIMYFCMCKYSNRIYDPCVLLLSLSLSISWNANNNKNKDKITWCTMTPIKK